MPLANRPSSSFVRDPPNEDSSAGTAGGFSLLDQLELDMEAAFGQGAEQSPAPPPSPSPPPSPARGKRGRRSVKDRVRSLLERELRLEEGNGREQSAVSRAWRDSTEENWLDMLPAHWK
ncbi:hypothetical protein BST61_g11494 [Cercospora zeina]